MNIIKEIKMSNIKLSIIILIFITLIPLTILRIYEIKNDIAQVEKNEIKANIESAELINVAFTNFLEKSWSNQEFIGRAIISSGTIDRNYIESFFEEIKNTDTSYVLNRSWLDDKGKVYYSTNNNYIGDDLSKEDYIIDILQGKDMVLGDLLLDRDTNIFVFPVARAIKVNSQLKGIVLSHVECSSIFDILNLDEQTEVVKRNINIVDKKGMLIYSNMYDNNLPYEDRYLMSVEPPIKEKNSIYTVSEIYTSSINKEISTGVAYKIKEIGWTTIITSSLYNQLKVVERQAKQSMLIFAFAYLIEFTFAFIFIKDYKNLTNRFKNINNEIKEKNIAQIEEYNYESLEDLGKTFDNMIAVLRKTISENEENLITHDEHLTMLFHEFKTPLNVILSCIQVLENTEDLSSKEFEMIFDKYTTIQKQNSYRLLRLINNYIDMSKIQSNGWATDIRNANIVKIVEDITLSIVEYCQINNIDIIFDTDVEESIIAVDINMMERIMLNLISNAIKFTNEDGLIEVKIETTEDFVNIIVADNGIGIPEDKLNTIFDRFVQVENSYRRGPSGSGIGLYLVKTLVELHNGSIDVKSKVGVGTEFIVKLPNITVGDSYISEDELTLNGERVYIELSDVSN